MCWWLFKKKIDITGMPTMEKLAVIEELEDDILIHEQWACYVTQYPKYAETMGDYDWHMKWIEVYRNAIYYLQGGQ